MTGTNITRLGVVLAAVILLTAAGVGDAATYYLNAVSGKDANAGTSPQLPFRTLARASAIHLQAGDKVLLAAGQKFDGQLVWDGLSGGAEDPIVISSYQPADVGEKARPVVDAAGYAAGVLLRNCAHVKLGNLVITANAGGMRPGQMGRLNMRCGVLVEADQPREFAGFSLTNIAVKDVFFEEPGFVRDPAEVKSANGTKSYGWGIRFLVASSARIKNVAIADCEIANVSHTGLKLTAPSNGLEHVEVRRIRVEDTGGPGVQMSGGGNARFSGLQVNGSGSTKDTRNWGRGSGLWTWGSHDVIIEKSRFENANGPADSAGVHIDYNCHDVTVQYNLSVHNAGGFCEILGNNYNCTYRYNVSVNDGYRVKGRNGAFQEGKIFWLSGYTGSRSPRKGPFNTYFYNNTIYVSQDIVAKFSVAPTARGVVIANNIFYLLGRSESVLGDQNKPDSGTMAPLQDVVFRNNLFLRRDNWPADSSLQDQSPIIGDPEFQQAGGLQLKDYIPRNADLVRNRGIPIPRLSNDETGLAVGLSPVHDILGNRIVGRPDLGAVELP